MRLSEEQIRGIRHLIAESAGSKARVRVFGSRLDDSALGGDLDLLVECDDLVLEPALLAATLSGRISRLMGGRKVDVLLVAPNLRRLPVHEIALVEGVLL